MPNNFRILIVHFENIHFPIARFEFQNIFPILQLPNSFALNFLETNAILQKKSVTNLCAAYNECMFDSWP